MKQALVLLFMSLPLGAFAQGMLSLKSDVPVQLQADAFDCDDKVGRCNISGHVFLVSGSTILSADNIAIDFEKQGDKRLIRGALATGDVLLVDGDTMTTCDRIQLDSDLIQGTLGLAEIRVKKPGSLGALKGWDAYGAGKDIVYFSGNVRRTGQRTFHVSEVYFTPCDCGKDTRPIFSIKAQSADFEVGSGAVFYKPVIQPGDVALPFPFALPALYVPLSKRKSGLLPPLPRTIGADGFYIEQDYYWAPTQDFDLTAGLGWNATRGFRATVEARYEPSADLGGAFRYFHLLDTTFARPANANEYYVPNEFDMHRFWGVWDHRQGTYERWSLKSHLELASDRGVFGAVASTVAALSTLYVPSRLAAEYRGDAWRATLAGAYYQDFTRGDRRTGTNVFGPDAGRVVHRAPELAVALAPVDLGAGVHFGVDTRVVTQLALGSGAVASYTPGVTDAGTQNQYNSETIALTPSLASPLPDCSSVLSNDYATNCARSLRAMRVDVVPRLTRQFDIAGLKIRPEVFGLAALGATAADNRLRGRGFVGASLDLSTHIGRVFDVGADLRLRHRVRPLVRYLLIPYVFGTGTAAMDERDQWTAVHQTSFGFETDLYRKDKNVGTQRALVLSLVQSLNLGFPGASSFGAGDLVGRFTLAWSPATLNTAAAIDPVRGTFRQYQVGASVVAGSFLLVNMSYERILQNPDGRIGSLRINTGLFELLPGGAIPVYSSGTLHNWSVSAQATPVRGLFLNGRIGVTLPDDRFVTNPQVLELAFGARYTGACECFGVGVDVRWLPFQLNPFSVPTIMPTLYIGDFTFSAPQT